MQIFVTGGSGFVGQEILRQLVAAGHSVRVLVRQDPGSRLPQLPEIEVVVGDVTEAASLEGKLEGCDAVIHLVGIIREFPSRGITFERLHVEATRHVVDAARRQGVSRYLQMSANGSREKGETAYHRTKWRAEQYVRESSLQWTIFQPSLIYGAHDQFINMLAEQVRKLPAVPVPGDREYRLSPVAVADVATSFVSALTNSLSVGESYACGGPDTLSYLQLLDAIAAALGRPAPAKLKHPLWLMKPMINMLEGFSAFPITRDQLTMLLEGNVCDPRPWQAAFALDLTPLAKGLTEMLGQRS